MQILRQTNAGMLFLDGNCGRLDDDYYVIAGLTMLGQSDYLLMKHDTLVFQSPIIAGIITKYNTIKKLDEQEQNNPPCSNN